MLSGEQLSVGRVSVESLCRQLETANPGGTYIIGIDRKCLSSHHSLPETHFLNCNGTNQDHNGQDPTVEDFVTWRQF